MDAWELRLPLFQQSKEQANSDEELVSAEEIVRRANIAQSDVALIALSNTMSEVNYLFNGHDAKFMLGYANELN